MASNASRARSTVETPSSVRSAPWLTAATARPVSVWICCDQAGDLAGRGLRLLGELADLFGDDGEALALLAGAGGLDRGVERQQVGLGGDRGDRVDDPADALGALGQLADRGAGLLGGVGDVADRVGGVADGEHAVVGELAGAVGGLGRDQRALGAGVGGARGLLDGVAGVLDHPHLALGALRDVGHRGGDLADGAAGLVGRVGHLLGRGRDAAGAVARARPSGSASCARISL